MPDLNDMALFARVVDAGSFSGAARRMNASKSRVSMAVARLERALGARHRQQVQLAEAVLGGVADQVRPADQRCRGAEPLERVCDGRGVAGGAVVERHAVGPELREAGHGLDGIERRTGGVAERVAGLPPDRPEAEREAVFRARGWRHGLSRGLLGDATYAC